MPKKIRDSLQRSLVPFAAFTVLLFGVHAAREILIPLTFAGLFGMLVAPAVFWAKNHRIPPWVSIPLVLLAVVAAMGGFVMVLGTSIAGLIDRAPFYEERIMLTISELIEWAQRYGFAKDVNPAGFGDLVNSDQAVALAGATLGSIAAALSSTLVVVLVLAFLLFEAVDLPAKLRAAFGERTIDTAQASRALRHVKRYVVIKMYVCLGTGTVVGGFCAVTGVDFPVLWGLLAFILNFIPNVGSFIAGIPPVIIALVEHGPGRAVIVLIGYAVLNLVIGSLIEPPLLGRRLGISAFFVVLSLVVWGALWGPAGMLLAVPLTMLVKLGFEASGRFQWVAILLGGPNEDAGGGSGPGSRSFLPPEPQVKE